MRINGMKIVPILVSGIAVYLIGFVIYGLLFSAQYMVWSGISEAESQSNMWKMSLGWIMPLALSAGIGCLIKSRNIKEIGTGAMTGLKVGVFLILSCLMYSFVYSEEPWMLLALDSFHIILISLTAGAVLTAMKISD